MSGITRLSGGTINVLAGQTYAYASISGGLGTITNAGTVSLVSSTGGNAVGLGAGGEVTNSGTVSASGNNQLGGIFVSAGGAATVTNTGSVTVVGGEYLTGISLGKGGAINNSGSVTVTDTIKDACAAYLNAGGTITNSGSLKQIGPQGSSVSAHDGGTINNLANGTISGYLGINASSVAITVNNYGSITATGNAVNLNAGGTVTNYGSITAVNNGVNFSADGTVINHAGATISGYVGILASSAAAITLTNDGSITGSYSGVFLNFGGMVTNDAGATITGNAHTGVTIKGASGTVTNAGTITLNNGANADGVHLEAGGLFENSGAVSASGSHLSAVALAGSGTVTNDAGGQITVNGGSYVTGVNINTGGTVTNAGSIGVTVTSGHASGIGLEAGGTANNSGTVTITAQYASGVYLGAGGTLSNSGSVHAIGTKNSGVFAKSGGTITNLNGGSISGSDGIDIDGAAGSVTNAGTISGANHAITFAGAAANTLTLQAGSKLVGDVVGSTASGATNTLILQDWSEAAAPDITINAQGALVIANGSGEVDTLLNFNAIDEADATIAIAGNVLTQTNADGSKVVSTFNISGQAWTSKVLTTDAGGQVVSKLYQGITGQGDLSAEEYILDGATVIGTNLFYSGLAGPYPDEEVDYNGSNQTTRIVLSGDTKDALASIEFDYVGGVFSGSKFTYDVAPAGASYSSFEVDYDRNYAVIGEKLFGISGQAYTGEDMGFDASGNLSRLLLTGFQGSGYSALELDYSAGTYAGYKAFYDITGQSYTNQEVDVSATGQLEKIVYSGMTSTPYSSLEQDYANGALADTIYGYADVTGATYYAYQVKEDASGAVLSETLDLNDGGHTLVALTSGQTLTSLGDDKMTGSGATTFVLNAIYGADTITNLTSADTVSLSSSEFANFAALTSAAVQSAGNVVISASDGDTLTLKTMTTATLAGMSANFTFHA